MNGMKKSIYKYVWDPYPYLSIDTHSHYHKLRSILQNLQEIIEDNTHDKNLTFALRMLQDSYIPAVSYYNCISNDPAIHRQQTGTMEDCSDVALNARGFTLAPKFETVVFEGVLPNTVPLMFHCNFWKNSNSQAKKKLRKCMASEMIYLHGKTIPWRCQIRSLKKTAPRDVFNKYPKIYDTFIRVFACSLLGGYKHCGKYPSFLQRCKIYDWFIFRPLDKGGMINWIGTDDNQRVLENVWREYVLFSTSLIPSLRNGIIERYNWDKIEKNTIYAMDDLRDHIGSISKPGSTFHPSEDWFCTMKEILTTNSTFKRLETKAFVPCPKLFVARMAEECYRLEDSFYSSYQNIKTKFFSAEEDAMMKRLVYAYSTESDIPLFLLMRFDGRGLERDYVDKDGKKGKCNIYSNPFETPDEIIDCICELIINFYTKKITKEIKLFLKGLRIYTYQKLRSFFIHLHHKQTVILHNLPLHQYKAQLLALCKKHNKSSPSELSDYAGVYYYSLTCGFKGSLVPSLSETVKESENLDAWGNNGVSCSAFGDAIQCYHKKSLKKRRKSPGKHYDLLNRVSRIEPAPGACIQKTERKEQKVVRKFDRCDGSLLEINLTGHLLECPEGVITLCCYCANPGKYDVDKFRDGLFVCTRCPRDDVKPTGECFLCREFASGKKKVNNLKEIKVMDDDTNDNFTTIKVSICSKCYKNIGIVPHVIPTMSELRERRQKYDDNRSKSKFPKPSTFKSQKSFRKI